MSKNSKKKLFIGIVVVVFLTLLAVLLLGMKEEEIESDIPMLVIETPQKISKSKSEEIILDVILSSLGDAVYPAASMSISFDSSRLEFVGVMEGNVFVRSDEETLRKLPEWNCNPEKCNQSGKINIMYLDTMGGRNAFSKALLSEDENVVLRLKFRLRDSASNGDVCDLIFDDAVFAASDEAESLAMTTNTLKVRNGKIVIGE